ncbi:heavy metal-binding domain-containing protein [Sphingobacterium siyangense]|uniref:heavy metal-binding domain-containing protein n=1 Tax=Sphingobacterium siyangense TaxID=459529 RepID=UPI003DA3EB75
MFVNILIRHTTTNSKLPIAANVVIGTTVFSDIGTSYVDFFGGRSTSYEKKMREMCKRIIETPKQHVQTISVMLLSG